MEFSKIYLVDLENVGTKVTCRHAECHKDAKKYDTIPIKEVVDKQLGVMDLAAAVLCMENRMPMTIFGLNEENSIINTVKGKSSGTVITV